MLDNQNITYNYLSIQIYNSFLFFKHPTQKKGTKTNIKRKIFKKKVFKINNSHSMLIKKKLNKASILNALHKTASQKGKS